MYSAPTHYGSSNMIQRRDAQRQLEYYSKQIQWRSLDRVLDIGCGDGGITTQILKAFLSPDFEELIGIDINENMVKFANEHYRDARTTFFEHDVVQILPQKLQNRFDHVFSFYALHWVVAENQEIAFKNIYNSMTNGGDCLLVILGDMPVFETFRSLAKMSRWGKWVNNVGRYSSPYHGIDNSQKQLQTTMDNVGFQNTYVQRVEETFDYPSVEDLKVGMSAVSPYRIPEELKNDFLEDMVQLMRGQRDVEFHNVNGIENVTFHYSLLIARAYKYSR